MKIKTGIYLLIAACFFYSAANAQKKKQNDLFKNFHSFNSVQLHNGSSTSSVSLHSVNGFGRKIFAGIGVGFDYYYHRTAPLFLEGRYDLFGKERKLQLVAGAGIHVPVENINRREPFKKGDFKPGKLLSAGFDYLIPIKKDALIMGVAYSRKEVIQMVDNNVWDPVHNMITNIPIKEKYLFNRISVKIGWVF